MSRLGDWPMNTISLWMAFARACYHTLHGFHCTPLTESEIATSSSTECVRQTGLFSASGSINCGLRA